MDRLVDGAHSCGGSMEEQLEAIAGVKGQPDGLWDEIFCSYRREDPANWN